MFSLPFATCVKRLTGIGIVETSIESAKQNAEDNEVTNTYFLAKDITCSKILAMN
ncbi:hypothetical protein GCM10007358_15820 [Phocicoccus schoeneichii]|nr:hypothetical protein GCM10007358_15820 [Jeotgalicoccus schoeneichii]